MGKQRPQTGRLAAIVLVGIVALVATWWLCRRADHSTVSTAEVETQTAPAIGSQGSGVATANPHSAEPTAAGDSYLDVTVLDLATQATVDSCTLMSATNTFSCNSGGRVVLGPLPAGSLPLRVSSPGFVPQELQITLIKSQRISVDIPLVRGAVLSGLVTSSDHQPVANARVWTDHLGMQSPKPVETYTVSDTQGHYRLDGVDRGSVQIKAIADGWAETVGPHVALKGVEERDGLDIVLSHGGSIVGIVVGPDEKPVAGVALSAIHVADRTVLGNGSSGIDGSFRIDGLGAGTFTVKAIAATGRGVAANIEVKEGAEAAARIQLVSESIDGFVHSPSGSPVEDVTVAVYSAFSAGQADQSIVTGSDGKFQATGLAGAPYRVHADKHGKAAVEVAGIAAGGHADLVLDDAGRINGVVHASGLHPPDAFDVRLVPKGGGHGYRALRVASPDGTFAFEDVPTGHYEVKASATGWRGDSTLAEVEAGQTSEVSLTLSQGRSISGHVLHGTVPVSGCSVNDSAITDSEGAFSLSDIDSWVSVSCPDGSVGFAGYPRNVEAPADVVVQVRPPSSTNDSTPETFGGIGARMAEQDGTISIAEPMEGSPSFLAGLQPGDQIVAVDGVSSTGAPIMSVIQEIRGAVGTTVDLTILRPSSGATFDVYVERALISN